ncbi:hypothetical protein CS063_03415 [Sporanaerobium hydrogeniformans]|uniref:Uncharacterized protein n=1 Tax=Sporanaerobium hydrogeniformans TaxID=3072179 RepID=A0AC61DEL6_9FIRM|nr:response regulator [Sporanaerobium hydrogeniformans]PHV71625.1 hypothetical protein CS063_03415 [Sporanaerobium hydrogeniformans]
MNRKLKIFIVDDEMMAIQYLKSLLEKASPFYQVIGEAFNGAMALPQIIRLKPDIVFIDIRMPIMDGLELSEKILAQNKIVKIILLTSYRDFDYVKKGMEIGVTSYLLKNELTQKSVDEELIKIGEQLSGERKKSHRYTQYNLRRFLVSQGEEMIGDLEDGDVGYALVYIAYSRPIGSDQWVRRTEEVDAIALEDLAVDGGVSCRNAIHMENGSSCSIMIIQKDVGDSSQLLIEYANKVKGYCNEKNVAVSCIISDRVGSFFQLPTLYKEMEQKSNYLFRYGKEVVIRQKDIVEPQQDPIKIRTTQDIRKWVEKLFTYQKEESDEILKKAIEDFAKCYDFQGFNERIRELWIVFKYFAESHSTYNAWPQAIYTVEEIVDVFLDLLHHLRLEKEEQAIKAYSRKIIAALTYIHNNYEKNIAIQDIAEAVHLSEGHLRKLFRKEVDITLVDYLTNYRIAKAKEMMKAGEDKISDIYTQVGFTSSQYFSYVFKRVEGVSPSEYLKNLQ